MKLLDDVIETATATDVGISALLRKCLVLAYQLNNNRLKEWIDKELNGYGDDDELPPYRQIEAQARGLFVGISGASLNNQPLPAGNLEEKHRHFATSAELRQPIVAYDPQNFKPGVTLTIPWPPDLTVKYQEAFYPHFALNRAWQEIPNTVVMALTDTVRNRVLRFSLDLRQELGEVHDDPAALSPGKVDQYVTNYIFGGNNVIAASPHTFSQMSSITVQKGDVSSLFSALSKIGIKESELPELQKALEEDDKENKNNDKRSSLGQRTLAWLGDISLKLTKAGVDAGVDTAKSAATHALTQFLGLS